MYGLTEAEYRMWQAVLIADAERLELEERCRASGNLAEIDPIYDEGTDDETTR
jgi:hypothetical protein